MFSQDIIFNFFSDAFEDLHVKRIKSISNAVQGCVHNCSLAIHAIGAGLSQAQGLNRKHTIKQVDRLLSNKKLNIEPLLVDWVNFIIADKKEMIVSLDWTDFDVDNHATLVMSLQTSHGRNTPLLWKSYNKLAIKGHRNEYEDNLLALLKTALPDGIKVTIVAERGFSNIARYDVIANLGFDYIIRTKSNIYVYDEAGNKQKPSDFIPSTQRTKTVKNVFLTEEKHPVKRLIIAKKEKMKDAWIIATSRDDLSSSKIMEIYGKRWGIETSFKDIKNYKFGMGMSAMHTKSTERRDRLFLISAIAIALLTLLGKAGDSIGMERTIKANTSKTRTYSFWNQGCIYYDLLPKMKDEWLIPLMEKFNYYLINFRLFQRVFSII